MPRRQVPDEKRARANRNTRWNDDRMITPHGYVKVRVGRNHPLADRYGYAYEHRLVLAAAGVEIPEGHIVHHVNGVKTDNRIENLEVMSRGDHNREHARRRRRQPQGAAS